MNRLLKYAWAGMYVLCAALGTLQGATGIAKAALVLIAVLFFLPPALLLHWHRDAATVMLVRNLSALSLLSTLILLVLNFLFALSSEAVGNMLHYALIIVSSPMVCSGYWVLSLFLWACLLTISRKILKKK